jgi:hypothetical protein
MTVPTGTERRRAGAARTRLLTFIAGLASTVVCMASAAAVAAGADASTLRAAGAPKAISAQQALTASTTL